MEPTITADASGNVTIQKMVSQKVQYLPSEIDIRIENLTLQIAQLQGELAEFQGYKQKSVQAIAQPANMSSNIQANKL